MKAITTVTGPVAPDELGKTLPHEHLFVNTMREFRGSGLVHEEPLLRGELELFKQAGGGTIVELSLDEIGRNPEGLKRLSQATGVNIVMGCGHYRDPYLDRDYFDRHTVDQIAAHIIDDIENGVADTDIRAGIIGEIGADQHYVSATEERSFRAAARAHHHTNLTITTHAARWTVGRQQLALLTEEGVDPRRVIIGHCDSVPDPNYHLELAHHGAYVAFDGVGTGTTWDTDVTVEYVVNMVQGGYVQHVLLSHDVHLRGQHKVDGGCGFTYVFDEFAPRLLAAGITEEQIETMTVHNPRAALTGERVD